MQLNTSSLGVEAIAAGSFAATVDGITDTPGVSSNNNGVAIDFLPFSATYNFDKAYNLTSLKLFGEFGSNGANAVRDFSFTFFNDVNGGGEQIGTAFTGTLTSTTQLVEFTLPADQYKSVKSFTFTGLTNQPGAPDPANRVEYSEIQFTGTSEPKISVKLFVPAFVSREDARRYTQQLKAIVESEAHFLELESKVSVNTVYGRRLVFDIAKILAGAKPNSEAEFGSIFKNLVKIGKVALKIPQNVIEAIQAAYEDFTISHKEKTQLTKIITDETEKGNQVIIVAYSTAAKIVNAAYTELDSETRNKVRLVYIAPTTPNISDPLGQYTTEKGDLLVRTLQGLIWNTDNMDNILTNVFLLDLMGHDLNKFYTRPNSNTLEGLTGIRAHIRSAIHNASFDL